LATFEIFEEISQKNTEIMY